MKRVCAYLVWSALAVSACSSGTSSSEGDAGGKGPSGVAGAGGASTGGAGAGDSGSAGHTSGGASTAGNGAGGAGTAGSGAGGANAAGAPNAAAGASNAGSGGGAPVSPCGVLSGNWLCDQGVVHRVSAGMCDLHLPPDIGPSGSDEDECSKNSDCNQQAHGYCSLLSGMRSENQCLYACVVDADCAAGNICLCGAIGGRCSPTAACKTDADCSGRFCAEYNREPSLPSPAFACQTALDACSTDADCRAKSPLTPFCQFSGGHRGCVAAVNVEAGGSR